MFARSWSSSSISVCSRTGLFPEQECVSLEGVQRPVGLDLHNAARVKGGSVDARHHDLPLDLDVKP
jgi:hypothetical protein